MEEYSRDSTAEGTGGAWYTWYRKKKHIITYSSGGRSSQIDYILVNKKEMKNLKTYKVIPGSDVINQHNLVVLDMWHGKATKAKVTRKGRFRIWELNKIDKKIGFRDKNERKVLRQE